MKPTITFSSYFSKISIIAVLFLTLPMLFSLGGDLSTAGSYICSCLCFFTLTLISVKLLLGNKYMRYYAITFIVQILIGLAHYLIFLDPDYFSSSGDPVSSFWREYLEVFNNIKTLIDNRHEHGLFYFSRGSWEVTHPEIWWLISWPATFLGHRWLNYAPLNVFASLLASINIMVWYNQYYLVKHYNHNAYSRYLLFFTAFFPQFLLNDTVWRDPFGVALISVGLVMLSISESPMNKGFSFILLAVFSFFQRTVYMLVAGATFAIREVYSKKRSYGAVLLLPFFAILMIVLFQFFSSQVDEGYASGYVGQISYMSLPIKFLFGLIGPFPWIQFFVITKYNAAFYYQLQDYVTGVFQIGYLYAIIANWKSISFHKLDYMTIMGFLIALSGFMTTMMHIGYISEGLFFTLPWFFNQIGSKFKKYFFLAFISLFILNILTVTLGVSGMRNILI